MALDVYVMPLWRFKAGDFTSPIEAALGIQPTIISGEATALPARSSLPWYIRLLARIGIVEIVPPKPELTPEERCAIAVQQVDALKRELTTLTGTTVDWSDTGDVHYNKQFYHPKVLRAFAAWVNHRDVMPEFTRPSEGDYFKHPIWEIATPPHQRFSALIEHSLHTGYFFPVPFEGRYQAEPFTAWGFPMHHDVASTQTILRDLAELISIMDTLPIVRAEDGSSPIGDARWYAEELQRICTLGVEHGVPVIFYG